MSTYNNTGLGDEPKPVFFDWAVLATGLRSSSPSSRDHSPRYSRSGSTSDTDHWSGRSWYHQWNRWWHRRWELRYQRRFDYHIWWCRWSCGWNQRKRRIGWYPWCRRRRFS